MTSFSTFLETHFSLMATLTNVSFGIRICVFNLVLISVVLILTAPGVCFRALGGESQSQTGTYCGGKAKIPMDVGHWSSYQLKDSKHKIFGQLAVVIGSLVLSIPPLIFICFKFQSGSNLHGSQILYSFINTLLFAALGGFETWYATGFGYMTDHLQYATDHQTVTKPLKVLSFFVIGWIISAVILFLCALLFVVDGGLVCFRRGKYHVMYYK
ncbi:hypothetical protein L596_028831 [Steinernema carpocapsae]|uniref:Uncharacterized protein n=1 Tax=Steinernema carpocapsae TaxID=34508 RepID=A0A4U5M0K2_STECR|nr:hypothetical protein L596_028831 [Steinernema carpocapsae]